MTSSGQATTLGLVKWMASGAAVLSVALFASPGEAELCAAPWRRLPENARQFVRPAPLILTGASAIPPLVLSPSGGDHSARRFAQTDLGGSYFPEPVSIAAPYVFYPASILFYTAAAFADWCPGQTRGAALIQGTTETILIVGLLKWTTGRVWPLAGRDPDDPEALDHPEDARRFEPFRRGLGAFPSGHTAFFFAAAAAFRASSPDLGLWRFAGYPIAAAVGFAMWYGDHHWASDVLSGGLLGEAIGGSAGRTWAPSVEQPSTVLMLVPVGDGALGLVSGNF